MCYYVKLHIEAITNVNLSRSLIGVPMCGSKQDCQTTGRQAAHIDAVKSRSESAAIGWTGHGPQKNSTHCILYPEV